MKTLYHTLILMQATFTFSFRKNRIKARIKRFQLLLALLFMISFQINGANITWTNGTGNNKWGTPTNWSTGSVPGSGDVAIFDGTSTANCNINKNVDVAGIRIDAGYTGTITQNTGNSITVASSGFSQADGVFTGGDAAIDINSGGAFVLSGGTFTSTSSTMSIGGTASTNYTIFNQSGGTFNHNGGNVIIDPNLSGCSTRTVAMTVTAPSWPQFYDFEVKVNNTSCNEDILNITSGDTIIVLNDFSHSDGYINSGVIQCEGNLFLNNGADGGTGTLYLTNTADVLYTNTSSSRFPKIVVNKSSGMVFPFPGTTELYCQAFHLEAGTFIAPPGTFYIGGSWNSNVTLLSHTGGTFDHNNGIVTLDPDFSGCSTRTATVTSSASPKITFWDLFVDVDNVSCNEDILNITSGDTLIVLNDFTHQDGSINTGVVRVHGDIYLNSGADGGSATIHINDATADQKYHNATTSRFAHINVEKAGGTFTPGVGTTDFYCQQFTLNSGAFTAPSGTFYIGGSWNSNVTLLSHTGGTFDHNNGIVTLDPDFSGCSTRTATVTSSASPKITFWDLFVDVDNVSCNEDILNIASGDTLVVLNDFTHQDGEINTGVVRVHGDIYLNSGADGGSATIHINDATADQKYHNATTSRFAHINVEKAGGTFAPGVGTTDFYCQQFTLNSGAVTAPSGTFYIGGSWNSNVTLISHTGGTFDHNNGIVTLDPDFSGCSTRTATVTSSASPKITFWNLFVDVDNVSCNEDILNIPTSDTIKVLNDFTFQDGYINAGTVWVEGDIFMLSGADGGTGTIYLTNTNDQEYSNASASRFPHICVDKTSGTVSPATGTVDLLMQRFTLVDGTFNCPTGNINIGGSWNSNVTLFDHIGGIFNHNNSALYLDPDFSGCTTRTATINLQSSTEFQDVYIDIDNVSCNEDRLTITGGDTLKVNGNLTLTDGQVNVGAMNVAGNVRVSSGFDGGDSELIFSGSTAQTFDLTGATSNFNAAINIDKTNNGVTLLSDLQMDAASGSDLYLNNGNLITSSTSLLIIGDNVRTYNATENSFVSGPMGKIGDEAFEFPIGENDVFAPLSISAPSNTTDHFTAAYIQDSPMAGSYDTSLKEGTIDHLSECEYWELERTNGSSNVNVTLSWDDRSCGVTVLSELAVASWDNTKWKDLGNAVTTGSTTSGTILSATAATDFNAFTLASASANNPLPIELLSYEVALKNSRVNIDWTTVTEINNDYFVVERSQDAYNFKELERVQGAGDSQSELNYAVIDRFPFEGISYYRLKQVDFDGTTTFYDIKMVDNSQESVAEYELTVFPNPILKHNKFSIGLEGFAGNNVQIKIQNMNGVLIYSGELNVSQENELIELQSDLLKDSGMYVVSVFSNDKWFHHKFLFLQ